MFRLPEGGDRFEPAHPRHEEIEHDRVRCQLDAAVDGFPPIARFPDDLETFLLQLHPQQQPHVRLVVDDEDTDGAMPVHGHDSSSIRVTTPPSRRNIVTSPPS